MYFRSYFITRSDFLSNKLYDILSYVSMIVLPALGTFYFTLAQIWFFPYGEEIVGTIAAVTTLLGTCLKVSSYHYHNRGD